MVTVRLNIKEDAIDRVMQSLNAFTRDEVVIIKEDHHFFDNQVYLAKELEEINNGNAEFVSHDELEKTLNGVLLKHENRL